MNFRMKAPRRIGREFTLWYRAQYRGKFGKYAVLWVSCCENIKDAQNHFVTKKWFFRNDVQTAH